MPAETSPAAIAKAFTQAWTGGGIDDASRYVADDVVFDGPLGHVEGKKAYIESLRALIRNLEVTGVRVVATFGDATQALIMYELLTIRFGALLCAKLLTIQHGLIQRDLLTFDSFPVRRS